MGSVKQKTPIPINRLDILLFIEFFFHVSIRLFFIFNNRNTLTYLIIQNK